MRSYLTFSFWQSTWQDVLRWAASTGLQILLILIVYWVARVILYRVIDAALARLMARQAGRSGGEDRQHRMLTLQSLVRSVVGYALFFVLLVMLLHAVSLDVTGLITTAGIGGVALGFGAQKLVKDVLSGFFLIVEDQFAVGDFVTIGPATGAVEEIGMRITRLRDETGRLWILSNGDINIVTNHSRAPVESFVEISLAPGADVKEAERIMNEAAQALAAQRDTGLLKPPRALGVSSWDNVRTLVRVEVVTEPRMLTPVQLRVREHMRAALVSAGVPVA